MGGPEEKVQKSRPTFAKQSQTLPDTIQDPMKKLHQAAMKTVLSVSDDAREIAAETVTLSTLTKELQRVCFICDETGKPKDLNALEGGRGHEKGINRGIATFLQQKMRDTLGDLVMVRRSDNGWYAQSAITSAFFSRKDTVFEKAIRNTVAYIFHAKEPLNEEEFQLILQYKLRRALERMEKLIMHAATKFYRDPHIEKEGEAIIAEITPMIENHPVLDELRKKLAILRQPRRPKKV
jgi:hypothetical protein